MKRMSVLAILGFGLLLLAQGMAQASYPEREITVYCSSSAGGITDLTARFLSEAVSKALGQPLVVVNKPGAAHTICVNLIANSKPDGYTFGFVGGSGLVQAPNFRKVPYDVRKDFTYIARCAEYPMGLTVLIDAPWKNLEEFLDYAKKNPGKVIYSSDGHGGGAHILMEYLAWKKGGIEWKHIPYSGGARNAPALLGRHTTAWAAAGSQVSFIRDGKMKMLASFNETRGKVAPDVPTLRELGYVDHPVGLFIFLIAPKGLPDPIAKKLEDAFLKAMKDPSYAKFMDKLEMIPALLGAKEAGKDIESQAKYWAELIKITGIKDKEEK